MKIYAATGHRPDKLGGYSVEAQQVQVKVAKHYLRKKNPDLIITGMALGWDTAWALAGLELDIPVVAAIPFKGQESRWAASAQEQFHQIVDQCVDVKYVCSPGYAPWKMQVRNRWMVDNCTKLVALWNGTDGGTANCLAYAAEKKRHVYNLFPKWRIAWENFTEQPYS